jgi:hypothetical protein
MLLASIGDPGAVLLGAVDPQAWDVAGEGQPLPAHLIPPLIRNDVRHVQRIDRLLTRPEACNSTARRTAVSAISWRHPCVLAIGGGARSFSSTHSTSGDSSGVTIVRIVDFPTPLAPVISNNTSPTIPNHQSASHSSRHKAGPSQSKIIARGCPTAVEVDVLA